MYQQRCPPTLTTLPSEVFSIVLSFLTPSEISRLRSTCSATVKYVADYRWKLKARIENQTVEFWGVYDFIKFSNNVQFWPFTNYKFGFPINFDLLRPDVTLFLNQHGKDIKSLSLQQLHINKEADEKDFFNQVEKLETLRINRSLMYDSSISENINDSVPQITHQILKYLHTIEFNIDFSSIRFIAGSTNSNLEGNWPNMRNITVKVYCRQARLKPDSISEKCILSFLDFLLARKRSNVKYLCLETGNLKSKLYTNPSSLVSNLENLTCLVLDAPNYEENDYSNLMNELARKTRLIQLQLTIRCPIFDSTFVGKDLSKPNFLEMTELKHCALKIKLDTNTGRLNENMLIGSTRNFIQGVVPRASLSCLVMECTRYPLFPVNLATVTSMLGGNVANTLKHFSWNDGSRVRSRTPDCRDAFKALRLKVKTNQRLGTKEKPETCKYCNPKNVLLSKSVCNNNKVSQ